MREYFMFILLFLGLLSTVRFPIGANSGGSFEDFECTNRFETKKVVLDIGEKVVVINNRELPRKRYWSAIDGMVDARHHYTTSGTVVVFADKRGGMETRIGINRVTGEYHERIGRDRLIGKCKTVDEVRS
jgi:hypothetical protein